MDSKYDDMTMIEILRSLNRRLHTIEIHRTLHSSLTKNHVAEEAHGIAKTLGDVSFTADFHERSRPGFRQG